MVWAWHHTFQCNDMRFKIRELCISFVRSKLSLIITIGLAFVVTTIAVPQVSLARMSPSWNIVYYRYFLSSFETLLILCRKDDCIECFDFTSGNQVYKYSMSLPDKFQWSNYPRVQKTNNNFVEFDEGMNLPYHTVDLLELIPDKIKTMWNDRLNLLVFGYIAQVALEFVTLRTIPMDIAQLISKFCPVFMDDGSKHTDKMDIKAIDVFTDIAYNLWKKEYYKSYFVKILDIHSPKVLDRLSSILIYCIINHSWYGTVSHQFLKYYYKSILIHIITSLGEESALKGLILCWIHDKSMKDDDTYSFIHLITKYGALNLMRSTVELFSNHCQVAFCCSYCVN